MTTPPSPTPPSVQLNDKQRKLVDTMKSMGAVNEEKARSADDLVKNTKMAKGQILALIQELEKSKIILRAHSNKTHRYYLRA